MPHRSSESRLYAFVLESGEPLGGRLEESGKPRERRAPQRLVGQGVGREPLQHVAREGAGHVINVQRQPVPGDEREIGIVDRIRVATPPPVRRRTGGCARSEERRVGKEWRCWWPAVRYTQDSRVSRTY